MSAHPWLLVSTGVASGIIASWMPMGALALLLVWLPPVLGFPWPVVNRGLWSLAVIMGFWCGAEGQNPSEEQSLLDQERVTAWVTDITIRGPKAHIYLRTFGDVPIGIVAYAGRPLRGLRPGAAVVVEGPFRRLADAANPGGFDSASWGRRRGVTWQTSGQLRMVRPAGPFESWIFGVRLQVRDTLERLDPSFGAGVLHGILLGDRHAVPDPARRAFEATGTAHLLAVSGLHVAGVASLSFLAILITFLGIGVRRAHRFAALFSLVPTLGYILLADAPLSAQRAGVMVAMFMFGVALGRRPHGLDCLGFAATTLLISNPLELAGPGFQFSFGTVFALLLWTGRGDGPRQWLSSSAVASLASTPVQAWHFGAIVPCAALSNLLVTPLASVLVIPVGLLSLFLAPLWPGSLVFAAHLAEILVAFTESIAELMGGEWITGRWVMPLCLLPFAIALNVRRPIRLAILSAVLVGTSVWIRPPTDTVDFVSVGQGDAILIRSGGEVALIDVGPDPSARALRQYLRTQGISHIDRLYITHHHPDHFRGLLGLSTDATVRRLIHSGRPSANPEWNAVLDRYRESGTLLEVAKDGDLHLGRFNLRVFAPLSTPWVSENDGSIALRIDGPNRSILLTGDLEALGERYLLAQHPGSVDILKLGHHGSRTSTMEALLEAVRPSIAVVSLGLENRYGFPHAVVEERLRRRRVPVFRTDLHGLVRVHLDGEKSVTLPMLD